MPTPIWPDRLAHLLRSVHYDSKEIAFLSEGFKQGFSLGVEGELEESLPNNLASTLDHPEVVAQKIAKELSLGRIAGPFDSSPFRGEPLICSPIGVVPKKEEGKFRLIHHLSHPKGASVNDFIPPFMSAVKYNTVEHAIDAIKQMGTPCFLSKSDIESAFRLIPVHPDDHHYLGFSWEGKLYFDKCLPMGCSSACQIFNRFSSSIAFLVAAKFPGGHVLHVLDDFLFIAPSEHLCQLMLREFLAICMFVGIPVAKDKTEPPSTALTFLGIHIDTVKRETKLPHEKVQKGLKLLQELRDKNKEKCTLKELQSVTGFLNFCCSVLVPARAFLRRLIVLTIGLTLPYHHTRLTANVKQDLEVWVKFFQNFNGKSFFIQELLLATELELYTDAAQKLGFGAVFGTKWFFGPWPHQWKTYNIVTLELFPIVLAIEIWAELLANKAIRLFTDNMALVSIINTKTTKEPHDRTMILVRRLVLVSLKHNILVEAHHIPGKKNVLPDLLSRLQIRQFREMAPHMDSKPVPVPQLPPSLP